MRIDIPQDLPRRRETPSQAHVSPPQVPTSVQRHLQSLKERAAQGHGNQTPRRPSPSRRPERDREVSTPPRRVRDPREDTNPRRTRRDRITAQSIGMQLRPEERKVMLEVGRFRVARTRDLADTIYDGKQRKLDEDLRYLKSKGLV